MAEDRSVRRDTFKVMFDEIIELPADERAARISALALAEEDLHHLLAMIASA